MVAGRIDSGNLLVEAGNLVDSVIGVGTQSVGPETTLVAAAYQIEVASGHSIRFLAVEVDSSDHTAVGAAGPVGTHCNCCPGLLLESMDCT